VNFVVQERLVPLGAGKGSLRERRSEGRAKYTKNVWKLVSL